MHSIGQALNLGLHIAAGSAALLIGIVLLIRDKGTPRHRRWGRVFGVLACVVCASAGLALGFGYQPLFAVLTLTVAYQVWGGWRAVHWRARGPNELDACVTMLAMIACAGLVLGTHAWSTPTLSALGWWIMALLYDAARWAFPRRWFAQLWRYEHASKWIACVSGMASAMLGNVWRSGQPWSQLLPSMAGTALIVWFCNQIRQDQRALQRARWQDRLIRMGTRS